MIRVRRICQGSIIAYLALAAGARAESYLWDPNLDGGVTAAAGTWDLVTPIWAGAPGMLWPNEAGADADTAIFGGAGVGPFVVTVGAPIVANGLSFNTDGYTVSDGGIAANTLTLDGPTSTIAVATAGDTATINAIIAGSAGLTKTGAGVLTLSGVNTYGGVASVSGGVLSFSASANLGGAASGNALSVSNDSTLRFTGSTAENLGATRTLAIGAGGGRIEQAGAGVLTLSGAITAAAGNTFTKTGAGTLLLTANSGGWAGDVVVDAGILQVGNVAGTQFINGLGASNAARTITVNSGAILDFQGRDATGNTPAAFVVNGGTVRNTSGFTRMGNLTLNGGTIHTIVGNSATFQAMTFNGDVTVTGTAPSVITTTGGANSGIHLEKAGGVTFTVPDITGDGAADLSIATPLVNITSSSAANGFIKNGAGTLLLTGANTFSGTMTLNDGIVQVNTANTANAPIAFSTTAGGTPILQTNVALRVGNITQSATGTPGIITGMGTLALNAERTLTIGDTASPVDLLITVPITNGDATGRGLIKTGAGTVQFDGVNTYTGTLTVNDGTIILNASPTAAGGLVMANQAGGTGRIFVNSGITYRLAGNPQVNAAGNGAFIEGPGNLGLFGDRAFTVFDNAAGDDLVISASITNGDGTARTLRKEQIGRMVMRGDNTYTGATDIYRGTLVLDYSASVGSKLSDTTSATNLRGGALILMGNASAPATEVITSLGVPSASGSIQLMPLPGQALTFNLNAITRALGQGVVNFASTDVALGTFQTTTTNNLHGILGPYATFNGNRFATVSGGTLAAVASTVQNDRSEWQAAQNVVIDGPLTGALSNGVHSLVFDAAEENTLAIDNPAAAFTVRSGGILVSANVGANATQILGGRLMAGFNTNSNAGEVVLTNRSNGVLTVSSSIGANNAPLSTTQHLTMGGEGLIEITGRNFHLGNTNVHGSVRIAGGNAFSDFTNLNIGAGAGKTTSGGSILNLNGSSEGVGSLTGGAFTSQGTGELQLGTNGTLTINQTAATTYSALLTGSGTVIKKGGATLTMSINPQAFTGTLQVLGGQMDFNSSNNNTSGVTGVSTILLRGGSILSAQNGNASNDKFANGATIQLEGTTGNGLRMSSDQNASRTETVDKLEINAGANVLTITNTASSPTAAITVLAFANATDAFSRSNNATLVARSALADFGGPSTAATNRVTFASGISGDLVGGGGAAGSTNISVLPFAVGGVSLVTNPGDSFVTVGANGLRPLNVTTEYATVYADATATDNLSLSASGTALTSKTVNSLRVNNLAANVDLTGSAGSTLTLTSGALLVTAGANANDTIIGGYSQIAAGAADATPDELVVHVTTSNASAAGATLTLDSAIVDNGAAATSLTKGGDGTLILATPNSYSGATTINQGAVQFSAASQLGADGLIRLAGGTLQWGGANTTDISVKSDLSVREVELLGPNPFLSPANAGNILTAGNRFDVGANNVTIANSIGDGGVGSLTKTGNGTLTLNAAATYTGPTLVREGAMNFATIAPDTTSALWLAADTGAVTSTVTSGLNVQSLIVGAVFTGTGNSTGTLTVGGGAVNIGDGSGDDFVLIGYRDGTATGGVAGTTRGTVNFSAASSVNINVARMILGQNPNSGGNNIDGDLILSNGTNTVTAHQVIVGNSAGPGNTGAGVASSILLGTGTTTFNVDSFTVGGFKTDATVVLGTGGTFTLRGVPGGSSGANLFIGDNDAAGTGTTPSAANTRFDMSAGTADIKADLLVIGRHASGAGNGAGSLIFTAGAIEAQTMQLAVTDLRGSSTADATTAAVVTQNGGTLRFGNLSKGNGTATYNWNAGTLANASGRNAVNQNVAVSLLTAAPHLVEVEDGRSMTFETAASFIGAGGLFKTGDGTLQLNGPSTFGGGTSIEEGVVLANNATGSALGTGAITVSVSGTLGGTGSVSGPVTVDIGGTIAPGASIESLSTGAVVMNGGSTFALEINTSGVPASDLLAVTGAFTLDLVTSPALTISDLGSNVLLGEGTTLPFVTYTGAWNGGLFAVNGNAIADEADVFTLGANFFTIDYDLNGDTVALVAVPEPGTSAILLGGLASLLASRRRRTHASA